MATKTRRGELGLVVKFKVDGAALARVIAYAAKREKDGSYTPLAWARTRTSAMRGVVAELHREGAAFFAKDSGWSGEINIHEIPMAVAAGKAIVARFFPELEA